jgi:uncharacterized protein
MARLLSQPVTNRLTKHATDPDLLLCEVRDKAFVYDVNSLMCYELDERDTLETIDGLNCCPQFPASHLPGVVMLVFEATQACNIACKYCFARNYYDDQTSRLSLPLAERALRYFFLNYKPKQHKPQIGFFGGEPLVNWPLIPYVVDTARAILGPQGTDPRFSMTTNAILVNHERAEYLAKQNFSFIVSLDGPAILHDELRVDKQGVGTYDRVIQGVRQLSMSGNKRITFRSTFGKGTVQLVNRLEHLNALCDGGLGTGVSVEPVSLSESSCVGEVAGLGFTEQEARQLLDEYLEGADWFIARIKAGKRARWFQITKTLERLLYTRPACSECGGGVGYASVASDGTIYACHREMDTQIGNIYEGGIDERLRAKWSDNRMYSRPDCMKCPLRYMCGGGCRQESLTNNQDITKPYGVACAFRWVFFKTALWIMSVLSHQELRQAIPNPTQRKR